MANDENENLFIKEDELIIIALIVNIDRSKAFYVFDKNQTSDNTIDYKNLHSYALKCITFSDSRKCFVCERPFGFVNVLREDLNNVKIDLHEYREPGFYEIYDRYKLKGKLNKVLENED